MHFGDLRAGLDGHFYGLRESVDVAFVDTERAV
jgi:hypothetical protein